MFCIHFEFLFLVIGSNVNLDSTLAFAFTNDLTMVSEFILNRFEVLMVLKMFVFYFVLLVCLCPQRVLPRNACFF